MQKTSFVFSTLARGLESNCLAEGFASCRIKFETVFSAENNKSNGYSLGLVDPFETDHGTTQGRGVSPGQDSRQNTSV